MKLTHGGFQVPGGFIVKSSGFDEYAKECDLFEKIEKNEGDINAKRELIVDIFKTFPIQQSLKNGIEEMLKGLKELPELKAPLLAVRSSGVTEDLEEASFAGMNDSILNVPTETNAVCEAIMKCWLSLYGKRSIVYRQENGFPPYRTSIAVVVQIMIPSDASGVVFTADPQSGSRGQISLDGVQGLGEALVSGSVNTDHWIIRKPYLKRELFIESESVGQQEFKLCSNYPQPGTTTVQLSKEEGLKQAFTIKQVHEICNVACGIEAYYKQPMDIEFCYYKDKLYIVQARPITKLPQVPDALNPLLNQSNPQWSCWFSFNSIQMIPDPMSVSFLSFMQTAFGISDKYLCQINGYLYINIAGILYAKPIRTKFIGLLQSTAEKEIGNCLKEFYENDYAFYKKTMSSKPIRGLFNCVGKTAVKNIIKVMLSKAPAEELIETLNHQVALFLDYARQEIGTGPDDLLNRIKGFGDYFLTVFPKFVIPVFIKSILARSKIAKIAKKYDLGGMDINDIWGNHTENIAMKLNMMVSRLGIGLQKIMTSHPDISDVIMDIAKEKKNDELVSLIHSWSNSADSELKAFAEQWNVFMDEMGCRGPKELDVASPRYVDNPCLLLNMLINLELSSYKDEQTCIAEREEATKKFLSLLSKSDRKKVEKHLPFAHFFSIFREHPKYVIVNFILRVRSFMLTFGKELQEKGVIQDVNDVFFLKFDEVRDYKLDQDSARIANLVKERKLTNQKMSQWPRAIMGPECVMKVISDTTRKELENLPPNMLKGMPTSAGVVEGVAVVCTDPEEAVIKKGEILIAPATDPGWTPLFVPAAGVAIEIGGALSHGSVVAREMGIPCVVNIQGLLKRVQTGMRIRIDGSQGTVEILDEAK